MPVKLWSLALAAILAIVSAASPLAARAAGHSPGTAISQAAPAAATVAPADPDAPRREYNRWMLSVSVCALAGALVGTAVVTSTPLLAGTAMVYATAPALVAATTAVGGYLGALWVDY